MTIHYVLAFLLYVAAIFACLGSIMCCPAISIRIGLLAFLFLHSDYCDSNTRAAHCFSGFDLHLSFVCWLQIYTVAKHTVSVITFNGKSFWSVLATGSVFLVMDEGHFKWVSNHVAYEHPASVSHQMDLTFFKSCALVLKHFEAVQVHRCNAPSTFEKSALKTWLNIKKILLRSVAI